MLVLAVALIHLVAGVGGVLEPDPGWILASVQAALVIGQALALLVRHTRPVTSATLVVLLHCALLAMSGAELGIGSLAVMISVFTLVRRAQRARAYWTIAVLAVISTTVAFFAALLGGSLPPAAVVGVAAARLLIEYMAPAVVAELALGREQLAGAAREKKAFGDRERTYLADQGRRAERTALARELHDIAGHHLSGIIVSAQAAGALIDSDPARSRSMLRELEQEARATMVDLRGTVGLLRPDADDRDDAGRTPVGSPGVGDLPELVGTAERRGQRVSYTEAGEPFRLGPLAEASVYRMVQESLANSARHAPGARCSVSLEYSPDEMVVLVDNEAPGPDMEVRPTADGRRGDGRGYGLVGMNERAELIGADLSTGPSENGGWRNVLRVPRPGGGSRR